MCAASFFVPGLTAHHWDSPAIDTPRCSRYPRAGMNKSLPIAARIGELRAAVWEHYRQHGRSFPWRFESDPYRVLVSEVMLQQTQTERVRGFYQRFLEAFPTFGTLAQAPLAQVLRLWQGLGYNRRARALRELAREVVARYAGELPRDGAQLIELPGIGAYTAAAVCAFAFNKPSVFIETNIRTVFLYHFFRRSKRAVSDRELIPLIEAALERGDPRRWYYALMDYGAMLKKQRVVANKKSAHYRKQGRFKGSQRELRGMILRHAQLGAISSDALAGSTGRSREEVLSVLEQLRQESFLVKRRDKYLLAR